MTAKTGKAHRMALKYPKSAVHKGAQLRTKAHIVGKFLKCPKAHKGAVCAPPLIF